MRSDWARCYGQDRLPRYTSYPTAPHFSAGITDAHYRNWLAALPAAQPVSLYLHVPFCRAMCWYCGCHTSLTQRDEPIAIYTAALRREAEFVAEIIGHRQRISHIAFGGGTPTIMAPASFIDLMGALRFSYFVQPDAEIAIEIDPRTLTRAMTDALGQCGVNRASLGVQSLIPRSSAPSIACRVLRKRELRCSRFARPASPASISICSMACPCKPWPHASTPLPDVSRCAPIASRCSVMPMFHPSRSISARSRTTPCRQRRATSAIRSHRRCADRCRLCPHRPRSFRAAG